MFLSTITIAVIWFLFNVQYIISPPNSKSAVYANALAIEYAVVQYCEEMVCENNDSFYYNQIASYVEGLDYEYYELENVVVAIINEGGVRVYLEAQGRGNYEFSTGMVPSLTTRDESVSKDRN